MEAFIQRHQPSVIGVLSGFDRMRFRGTLRSICYSEGVDRFLGAAGRVTPHRRAEKGSIV